MAEKMDRGSDAMKAHFTGVKEIQARQTRRGWCQEILGCEARTEFKFFKGEEQFAHSLEDAGCCCRVFCQPIHPFKMEVKELNTEAELLTVDRPCACGLGCCKCCCYQTADFSSGGNLLGTIKEQCWYCVPAFTISDDKEEPVYIIHPPTCCGGCCVNCCAEGNPCTRKGCCKQSFRVYPYEQNGNTGGDSPYIGVILKKPKSALTEIFTDANALDVTFPDNATNDQKAILAGTSLFLNAIFFEGDQSQ
mmetsp:Transcript_20584/g.43132  ORF Transcript_20584/g.43132 Transcript_20584/m.43132 type:complete len:249 (-) Transcript_20584:177-923(-)